MVAVGAGDPSSPDRQAARVLSTARADQRRRTMPRYLIEREIPGAGKLSSDELRGISRKSCSVLDKIGPQIQWVQSYVTDDKIYCVYIAPNEEAIQEHASRGGFPANRISRIESTIDPTTAE
jgi:hypothetical protein